MDDKDLSRTASCASKAKSVQDCESPRSICVGFRRSVEVGHKLQGRKLSNTKGVCFVDGDGMLVR